MRFADNGLVASRHTSEGSVGQGDGQVWVEDQDAIRSVFQHRFCATRFIEALLIKLGILHGNSSLISKTSQKRAVIS